jgi:predicted ribosomally synthesized peptide with SipW-like signal peptide
MKNIALALIVVVALVGAGLGGTFAHFSDTEESLDNEIQIGSIDLKVIDKTSGVMYDDPLPAAFVISAIDIQPCESHDFTWQLKNTGQPQGDVCHVYMHIKNPRCEDVEVIHTGEARPEPEVVAEDGGWLGQVYVPGIGKQGDTCNLLDFVEITVYYPWDQVTKTGPVIYTGMAGDVVCQNLLLGRLDKCEDAKDVHVVVHFYDLSEDDLGTLIGPDPYFAGVDNDGDGAIDEDPRDGIDNDADGKVDEDPDDETGHFDATDPDIALKCWDHWVTNAFMKDKVYFDILFSLVQG